MACSISQSVGSYESGAKNVAADVRTVQQLLTDGSKKLSRTEYDPKGIDGLIHRVASQSGTVKAIAAFQRGEVRMSFPDSRIDVGGKTWQALTKAAGPGGPSAPKGPTGGVYTLTLKHGGKIPKSTTGKTATIAELYEGSLSVMGPKSGSFKASIYPDDMNKKGRLKDGSYPLHIGFHHGGGKPRRTAADLVVRTSEIRAALLVNARNSVPVLSNDSGKTTSAGINVHNGGSSTRGSEGCVTMSTSDWTRFMQIFLDAFPDINDWHTLGDNTGKKIGTLVVQS